MKLLTESDLIELGYRPGSELETMLTRLAELNARGVTGHKYLLKLLAREFGPPPPRLALREDPVRWSEALAATGKDEHENLYAVRRQMHALLKSPVITAGVILPDACPMGGGEAVIPVGAAIAAEHAIIPSAHSSDICCSMFATFYEERSSVAAELDALAGATRFGQGHRHLDLLVPDPIHDEPVWDNPFLTGLRDRAALHMADQGDGNHFAYLGKLEPDAGLTSSLRDAGYGDMAAALARADGTRLRVLITHHGSRGLGAHVFKRGQIAAEKHTRRVAKGIPEAAAWLDAREGDGPAYWEALQYVARWTRANHRSIHRRFLDRIGAASVAEIGNEHNFVWRRGDLYYHGKGATPAWRDESGRPLLGWIPLNMAAPVLLILGADNPEYLSFAPHGAGRNISRTALRRRFPTADLREYEIARTTAGLDIRWYCGNPDLSETPVAYKNAEQVRAQIERFGLARIIGEVSPLGCIMAGDTGRSWRDRDEELTPKQIRQIAHRADRRKTRQSLHDFGEDGG
jgi:RNA-splicing ligase RtcB